MARFDESIVGSHSHTPCPKPLACARGKAGKVSTGITLSAAASESAASESGTTWTVSTPAVSGDAWAVSGRTWTESGS